MSTIFLKPSQAGSPSSSPASMAAGSPPPNPIGQEANSSLHPAVGRGPEAAFNLAEGLSPHRNAVATAAAVRAVAIMAHHHQHQQQQQQQQQQQLHQEQLEQERQMLMDRQDDPNCDSEDEPMDQEEEDPTDTAQSAQGKGELKLAGNGKRVKKFNPLISTTEKCRVCLEPAAKHIHYGAVTCFSCRAFFRRSIQNKSLNNYTCRRQGECDITLKSRKNCQKCRFDKCLEVGMKPTWVLSEDERSRRFRKAREKKQQAQQDHPMSPTREPAGSPPLPTIFPPRQFFGPHFPFRPGQPIGPGLRGGPLPFMQRTPMGRPPFMPGQQLLRTDYPLPLPTSMGPGDARYRQPMLYMHPGIAAAVRAGFPQRPPMPMDSSAQMYPSPTNLGLPHQQIIKKEMEEAEQVIHRRENPHHHYHQPPTGSSYERHEERSYPPFEPLESTPGMHGDHSQAQPTFLPPRDDVNVQESPYRPQEFSPEPQAEYARPSSYMSMDANQPLSLVKNEVQDYDTGRFTEVEDEHDDDDSSDSSGLGGGIHRIIHEPPVEITDDEVRQIRRICDNHDRNYRSVAFGEELIKELVMCSVFKFPLSTSAAMTAYRLMIQRVTKVAQGFDTFIDFPHQTQKALLKQNADLLVSLRGAVFFEDKKKGLDQILYSMGVDDIDVGKKMIMTTMKAAGDLGRIDYQNYNSIQKLGDETTENRYNQLLSRVGATVSLTPELVKLLSYVVLLSPDFCELVGEDRKRVERVQDMMVNMLKRFIFSKYSRPVAVNVFARALTCIGDLREMSNIKKQRALAKPIDPDQAASGSQPAAVATADAQLVDDRETDGQSPAPSFYTTH